MANLSTEYRDTLSPYLLDRPDDIDQQGWGGIVCPLHAGTAVLENVDGEWHWSCAVCTNEEFRPISELVSKVRSQGSDVELPVYVERIHLTEYLLGSREYDHSDAASTIESLPTSELLQIDVDKGDAQQRIEDALDEKSPEGTRYAINLQRYFERIEEAQEQAQRTERASTLSLGSVLDDDTVKEYDWLITGLLERTDRMTLTGGEGDGKTLWQLEFGVKAAAGIHPTTDEPMEPIRVLFVDLENGPRKSRRELRRLVALLTTEQQSRARDNFYLDNRPEGLYLDHEVDKKSLRELLDATRPDLLIIGPRCKMVVSELSADEAKRIQAFLDSLRIDRGIALITEAHMPYGQEGSRTTREYGPSSWSRWPEFGFHLRRSGELVAFRQPRDTDRSWCSFRRNERAWAQGRGWPWEPLRDGKAVRVDTFVGDEVDPTEVCIALQAVANKGPCTLSVWKREMRDLGLTNTDKQEEVVHQCRINGWVDHQVDGTPMTEKPGRKGVKQNNVLTEAGMARLEELNNG